MRIFLTLLVILLVFSVPIRAQLTPESAHVQLYFPQFADGGPFSGQWQTTFTFANPNDATVSGVLYLISDAGGPLQMDFGSGLVSSLSFSVTPFGTRTFQSRVASPTIIT